MSFTPRNATSEFGPFEVRIEDPWDQSYEVVGTEEDYDKAITLANIKKKDTNTSGKVTIYNKDGNHVWGI